jgi:uncharacterized membrane protein YhdT
MENDPLAVIRVTFDDMPSEFKIKLELFFILGCISLILLNIVMSIKLIEIIYDKYRKRRYQQIS